jgi:hypothetical protein
MRTNVTTLLLHNYGLKSNYKDYQYKSKGSLTCLVVL